MDLSIFSVINISDDDIIYQTVFRKSKEEQFNEKGMEEIPSLSVSIYKYFESQFSNYNSSQDKNQIKLSIQNYMVEKYTTNYIGYLKKK